MKCFPFIFILGFIGICSANDEPLDLRSTLTLCSQKGDTFEEILRDTQKIYQRHRKLLKHVTNPMQFYVMCSKNFVDDVVLYLDLLKPCFEPNQLSTLNKFRSVVKYAIDYVCHSIQPPFTNYANSWQKIMGKLPISQVSDLENGSKVIMMISMFNQKMCRNVESLMISWHFHNNHYVLPTSYALFNKIKTTCDSMKETSEKPRTNINGI